MKEKDIESWCKKKARDAGWFVRKFTSPANRSVPDDIFIKDGKVFFVEFKATGAKPTLLQAAEHKTMREHGATVLVCDSRESFAEMLKLADEHFQFLKDISEGNFP